MSTIQSINRTAEDLRATSADPSDQKPTLEQKVELLAPSLLKNSLEPRFSTPHRPLVVKRKPTDHCWLAVEDFRSAAVDHLENGDKKKAANCYTSVAEAYLENGDEKEASKCYGLAAYYYSEAADAYRESGDNKEAAGRRVLHVSSRCLPRKSR